MLLLSDRLNLQTLQSHHMAREGFSVVLGLFLPSQTTLVTPPIFNYNHFKSVPLLKGRSYQRHSASIFNNRVAQL